MDIMAGTLGVRLDELCELARQSENHVSISSMCTVFAESEVVSLIGRGTNKEDIAYGIVESIASKVWGQLGRLSVNGGDFYLSGGLCELPFILEMLSEKIGTSVEKRSSCPLRRGDRRRSLCSEYEINRRMEYGGIKTARTLRGILGRTESRLP